RISRTGAVRQRLSEQSQAEVAIEEGWMRRPADAALRDVRVEAAWVVVGIRVANIRGFEVVGQPRQARMLGREIQQRNLIALGFGRDSRRQQFAYWFVQPDHALRGHPREKQTGEGLGDGSYFEDGVRVRGSIREDAAHAMVDYADGDAAVFADRK